MLSIKLGEMDEALRRIEAREDETWAYRTQTYVWLHDLRGRVGSAWLVVVVAAVAFVVGRYRRPAFSGFTRRSPFRWSMRFLSRKAGSSTLGALPKSHLLCLYFRNPIRASSFPSPAIDAEL